MRTFRIILRIVLGAVFVFSGYVKGIDPQGFAIKLSEYFESFGFPEMEAISIILAVLVCVGEFIIGICLVLGLRMKITAWAALLFMAFFTFLTLYIAIANPVSDCGCFGDAIKLTNWQTFYKNLFFIAIAFLIFWQRNKYKPFFKPFWEWIIILIYVLSGTALFIYCNNHLPFIDFRPYHIGADIKAGMVVPEGEPVDEFSTSFIYKKDGVEKEFSDKDYPWNDSTWVWVETKQVLVKKGYEPPIHDFSITTASGNDITDSLLYSPGYTFLLISPELKSADKVAMTAASELAVQASEIGVGFYCLSATAPEYALSYQKALNLNYPFCVTDKTTLKTIIRSNPGLVLIKEGIVIGQWHYNDFPDKSFVTTNMLASQLNNLRKQDNNKLSVLLISIFMLSAALLTLLRKNKSA